MHTLLLKVQNDYSAQIQKELQEAKAQLQNSMQEKAREAMFRCKTNWHNEGEHNLKYFSAVEKYQCNDKTMRAARLQDGTVSKDSLVILKEQSKFYKKLYFSDKSIAFLLINKSNKKISEDRATLEAPISMEELISLKSMPNNKTPRIDGLPGEFYKMFCSKLGHLYWRAINQAVQKGCLSESTWKRIINLIPKNDRDGLLVKNWGPITLLTVDHKIYDKALALWMKTILPSIINLDQTGFMKGRNISTNIRKMLDIIDYTEKHQIPAVIMSIDFKKCIDQIEYTAIKGALQYYNFGPVFTDMVKALFSQYKTAVSNDGFLSPFFHPTRGCHQGSPISLCLYLLCGEIMADLVRNNNQIKGTKVLDTINLISQFADDMDLFLLYDLHSLNAVCDTLTLIERNTGQLVNYEKTNMYRIGLLVASDMKLYTHTHKNNLNGQMIQ